MPLIAPDEPSDDEIASRLIASLIRYEREKVPPAEEPRRSSDEIASRRAAKHAAHAAKGKDLGSPRMTSDDH
jgi:hypothetical protein